MHVPVVKWTPGRTLWGVQRYFTNHLKKTPPRRAVKIVNNTQSPSTSMDKYLSGLTLKCKNSAAQDKSTPATEKLAEIQDFS